MPYLRRIYRLPPELEDRLVADLWLAGTLGVATEVEADGRLRLTAWFEREGGGAGSLPARETPPGGTVELLVEDEPPDADWLAEYRRRARRFRLGRSLIVDPGEPGPHASMPPRGRRRRLLRLPARTAFGTGSHESTRLAIELLEDLDLRGRALLDVGTGTGVLAFAALAFRAARVVGFDADPEAAFQARANSRLNGLAPRLFAGRPAALAPDLPAAARFDVAVINVVPEQILPEIADLLPALSPRATVILSGLLVERAAEISARLAALGLAESRRRRAGEWAALELAWHGPARRRIRSVAP
jgi:ribosomal protein L11 methyltransferase